MSRELSNPLQALILGAAKSLPAQSGETDRFKARISGAGQGVVILADVSSSMAEKAGGRSKSEILREALDSVWGELPGPTLIGFGSTASTVTRPDRLPAPNGGTAMHLALDAAATHRPAKTLVISDGQPDSEEAALAAAERLGGVIDVIYCGPDSDQTAIDFMRRLARLGCGRVVIRDVVRDSRPGLAAPVRSMLGLPTPTRS